MKKIAALSLVAFVVAGCSVDASNPIWTPLVQDLRSDDINQVLTADYYLSTRIAEYLPERPKVDSPSFSSKRVWKRVGKEWVLYLEGLGAAERETIERGYPDFARVQSPYFVPEIQ